MGKIDIRAGSTTKVFPNTTAPELARAVHDAAFASRGAIGVEIEFFAFEHGQPGSLGQVGSRLTPGDFIERLAHAAGAEAELVRDPKNGYPCGVNLSHGGRFCLENGGQIEYASSPCQGLDAVAAELEAALALCEAAGGGEVAFLSHGTHPTLEPRLDPLVPNSRYTIMERFFAPDSIHRWGNYASSIQINLDPPAGAEWDEAVRLSFAIARFGYHLFANSRYLHGAPADAARARLGLTRQMDPTRRDVPASVVLADDLPTAYAQWALDASVIFAGDLPLEELPRRGELSFRAWLEHGYKGRYPSQDDWQLHLGTLWPDVRPRKFIEVRSTDAQPFAMIMPAVAFWHALIQRPEGHAAARAFLASLPGAGDDPLAHVLECPLDAPLLNEPTHHDALLAAAEGVLEAAGLDRWARAVAAYRTFLPAKADYWQAPSADGFVGQALSARPAFDFKTMTLEAVIRRDARV